MTCDVAKRKYVETLSGENFTLDEMEMGDNTAGFDEDSIFGGEEGGGVDDIAPDPVLIAMLKK